MRNFEIRKGGELVGEGTEFTGGRIAVFWYSTRSIQEFMSLAIFAKIHCCCDRAGTINWLVWPRVDTYRVYQVDEAVAHLVAQGKSWESAEAVCGAKPLGHWRGVDTEQQVARAQNLPLCLTCSNSTSIS